MTKYYLLLLIIGLCLHSGAQESKKYKIKGKILNGIDDGKAYLRYFTDSGRVIDSSIVEDGKFEFKGKLPSRQVVAKLHVEGKNDQFPLFENSCEVWLEEGEINIEADQKLVNAVFTGSSTQKDFSDLQKSLAGVNWKGFKLDEAYEKAEAEKDKASKDRLIIHDYPALFRERQQILGEFIRLHPSSLISAYKFEEFAGSGEMNLAVVEPVYALLDESIKKNSFVVSVARLIEINKRTAPGMQALEASQTDTSGNLISLSSFTGKYLLIDFWAGWCVPCRAENPFLKTIYDRFNSKGLEIVGVSLDGERKRWVNAIRDDKLPWPQVSDLQIFDNAIAKQYGITSIPQNILIGPDGIIIAKNIRGEVLEKKLAELLK